MIVGLDHGQLAAPPGGELQARSFCGELGLTELPKPPALEARGGMWFAVGASRQLHIGIEPEFVAARRAHPALTLDSTAALGALAGKLARPGCEPT